VQRSCAISAPSSERFLHCIPRELAQRACARDHARVDLGAMTRLASFALLAALAAQPACYGSYSASHALNRWNGHVTGSDVGNSAVHLLLWIVPVYELTFVGDFLVFNNIEFITKKRVFD
jgi:hypothetical protein